MKHQKGFTIIEVVLVLAIGGLILSMVFFALPAMLGNQRDTDRRNDVITFIAKLKEFESNSNRGGLPEGVGVGGNKTGEVVAKDAIDDRNNSQKQFSARSWDGFYRDYFDNNFTDPEYDIPYSLYIANCQVEGSKLSAGEECNNTEITGENGPYSTFQEKIFVVLGSICDGEKAVKSSNSRRVSALYKLERGGTVCQNT